MMVAPLYWAAYSGHQEIVKLLLDKGADTNKKNIDGNDTARYCKSKRTFGCC